MASKKNSRHASSIVLGLNDALVELTGALAGFTFALQNSKLIAMVGFITGFAASLSMAASSYLHAEEEKHKQEQPQTSALYTGLAYFITVLFLISPFLFFTNVFYALSLTILIALLIIAVYNHRISNKKQNFFKKFTRMALISLSVALLTFVIGYLIRTYFGLEI